MSRKDNDEGGRDVRFSRITDNDTTHYRAEGTSYRYTAQRIRHGWRLRIWTLETVAGIRVAEAGAPKHDDVLDTLTLCKDVASEFEALGDDYRSADHGHRERITEATLRAYATPEINNQGEIMTDRNDVNTDEGQKVIEQIDANIERALSLTDPEAIKELEEENEALVSSLSGKGSIKVKTEKRAAFTEAANTMPEDVSTAPTPKAEVETVDPKDYSIYAGVTELIADGAARVSEGVKLHLKTSDLAKDVAAIMLDMWHRIPNKDGNPDILGASHAAKEAARALYNKAGEGFERSYDTEEALKKLQRAVQHQRSDVRAQYLRSLDQDQDEQKRFAKALEAKPEDVSVSQFIADLYGTALKGHGEIQRERYQAKQAITSGGEADAEESEEEPEEETTPDERVRSLVQKLKRDVAKAKPEEFESASEDTKEAVRAELEELFTAVKAMITATLK
jgi:tetratricopeptide (TPR) repeat protein